MRLSPEPSGAYIVLARGEVQVGKHLLQFAQEIDCSLGLLSVQLFRRLLTLRLLLLLFLFPASWLSVWLRLRLRFGLFPILHFCARSCSSSRLCVRGGAG